MIRKTIHRDSVNWRRILTLARHPFGYDALQALQAHYADCAVKKSVIEGLLVEIERHENTVAF